jgi:branched-chain amino acid transport system ATP-binding protein/branched-chain amino acid transport system permease protein
MQFGAGRASLSRPPSATTSAGEGSNPVAPHGFARTGRERAVRSVLGWSLGFGVLAIALVLPLATGPYVTTFVFALITALVLAQSWDWVGGQMGYINLGHFAFYGVGAYTLAILVSAGAPVLAAFPAAALATAGVAVLVSFPLFRLRGDYFAFATLALLPLCQILTFNLDKLTGGAAGIPLPPHYVLIPAYYLALVLAGAALALSVWIDRARFGYALKAIRNDEQAAELAGIRLLPIKIAVLVLSAVFAGLAGAIQTWQLGYIEPPAAFGLEPGLIPIAMALLGGSGLLLGPLLGVLVLGLVHQLLLVKLSILQTTVYGAVILLVGRFMPGGLLRAWRSAPLATPARDGALAEADFRPALEAQSRVARVSPRTGAPLLECSSVSMTFGGVRAVDNVSLCVAPGEIVGLVGPNGSGKTTLFNCISKVLEPIAGDIVFNGTNFRALRPDIISRLGIGRTYQIPRPFSDLTVEENVLVPLLFRTQRVELSHARREAREIAAFSGLTMKLQTRADALSLQEKKALEFARALACRPSLLLVDEVASGLTPAEVRHFVDLLRQIRDTHGTAIIWVEHIFWALAAVVDRLVVMENGAVLADGKLDEVVRKENVLRAYLGRAAEAL